MSDGNCAADAEIKGGSFTHGFLQCAVSPPAHSPVSPRAPRNKHRMASATERQRESESESERARERERERARARESEREKAQT